jgi:pantothenate kinase
MAQQQQSRVGGVFAHTCTLWGPASMMGYMMQQAAVYREVAEWQQKMLVSKSAAI